MKTTEKISDVVNNPKKFGTVHNSNAIRSLKELLHAGKTHTAFSSKRRVDDWGKKVEELLNKIKVPYIKGNDAPRGGIAGNFIKLNVKSALAEIEKNLKKEQKEEAERRAKEEADKAAKEERRRKLNDDSFEHWKDFDFSQFMAKDKFKMLNSKGRKFTFHNLAATLGTQNNQGFRDAVMKFYEK